MSEDQPKPSEQTEQLSLDQLVQKKKEELKAKRTEKQEKQEKQQTKQRVVKEQKRATITIVQRTEPQVFIENLPKASDADVQELVEQTIGLKDVPVERYGSRWAVMLKNNNKRRQLVDKLDGSLCKENNKNLKVYIK